MTDNQDNVQAVRERILHVFSIYPEISPSMLQISLNLKTVIWRPIVDELVNEGLIKRSSIIAPTPTGRHQSYIVLKLVGESAK